ncbi:hypothetical protein BJ170DRAFT_715498 [Xylariales sp. AK1849]|nr:hypothetical protein BJ170DRAFT_715498 [Xylariales sp. AK1849]
MLQMASARTSSNNAWPMANTVSASHLGRPSKIIDGPWANEPWPLFETLSRTQYITHPVLHIANEVTHGYNATVRGLNAVYLQAPYVTAAKDIADLLFLTHCWSVWVLDSRILRQTRVFPEFEEILERPGAFPSSLKGELDFGPALHVLSQYAEQTQSTPECYDCRVLQEMIEILAPPLHENLARQISMLVDMIPLCGQPGSPEAEFRAGRLLQVYLFHEAEASNTMDRYLVPPMIMRMRDTTYEGGNSWPGLSVLAVHAIADRLSPAHAGAWRFLPCDIWGRPRELPFLGQNGGKRKSRAKVMFNVTPASDLSTESLVSEP